MSEHGFEPKEEYRPDPSRFPMKWHNFLIYFALWASGVLNIISGIGYFTGSQFDGRAEAVYAMYPGMKTVMIIFGFIMIAMGIYAIYTRFQLAGFKKGAPKKLLILYGANTVLALIVPVVMASVAHVPINQLMDSNIIVNILVSAVMIAANASYYNKRAELFVY